MKKSTAYMVKHTHWDREWYLPFEAFRAKLVRLIDGLLDNIDKNPDEPSFMLDGQTVALEDYLEIRPENAARLRDAVASGKITIGPWYVLPDELIVSGETHIRNYLYGARVCAEYGKSNGFGYLPDSFGHPAQMPQIINGLGLRAMIFWRGTSNEMDKTEFYWQSPVKGIKTLCVHMPYGYGNSAGLSVDMERTIPRLDNMIGMLASASVTDTVLLMNGSDHIVGQDNIVQIVKEYNARTEKPYQIILSTMEEFLDVLIPKLHDIETYGGELCYGDRALLLGGTLSTRTYLKQMHRECEIKMECYLEPIAALEHVVNGKYDFKGYADYIWKCILKNAPHDSICGCSVDEVHRAMVARYEEISIAQETQLNDLCFALCKQARMKQDVSLLVFEPTQDRLDGLIEIEVDFDPVLIRKVDFARSTIQEFEDNIAHPDLPAGAAVFDENGKELPCVLLEAKKADFMHLQDGTMPETYRVNRARLLIKTGGMDYGMHQLVVKKAKEKTKREQDNRNGIENEYYMVEFAHDSFTVLDKKTGKIHKGVCKLVDGGDAGDEYTYSWPLKDTLYTFRQNGVPLRSVNSLCKTLEVRGDLLLPQGLTEDRHARSPNKVSCPMVLTARLVTGTDRVDFICEIDNNAKDHRLQVSFPAGVLARRSCAYSTFAMQEYPIEVEIPEQYKEYPRLQHVCHGYASVSDGIYGVTGAIKGVCEYEAKNEAGQSYLLFTLMRCVGWLSRPDLITRNGNGGWMIATPGAQCIGKHKTEFSIMYHKGDILSSYAYRAAERFLRPQCVYPMFLQAYGHKKNPLSFLSELPACMRVTAVKKAENGAGLIIRMVNIGNKNIDFTLKAGFEKAEYMNLSERSTQGIKNDGGFHIKAEAAQIVTVLLSGWRRE